MTGTTARRDAGATSPWPFVGMVGMASAFFLYAATPTVVAASWWAVVLLLLGWLAALVVALRWFTRRPVATAVLSLGVILAWFVVVLGGAWFLGWS